METKAALAAFDALSQPTRLEALRQLVRAEPAGLPAGDLAAALDARQNTLSSHLKQLAAAGLVASRRDGRSVIYRANLDAIRAITLYLLEDCCAGRRDVCLPVAEALDAVCCRKARRTS